MDHIRSRYTFAPRQLVALVVIVAIAIGLGYVRFAPGPARLAVPAGARAGDLSLQPCTYATEWGEYAADCGAVVVLENRADPTSRLIALPVRRIKTASASPTEPIIYLEGGPGLSNMKFTEASRYVADRDLVLVGYRGIDGSVRLDCPEVASAVTHATDLLGGKFFRAYGDAYQACANRLANTGIDLTMYGLSQQVDDLEAVRVGLGYDRIDLLSQSAGTRTAMIYTWRFPERIHRSVMIGVNPPGHFLYDAQTIDEQIGRYAELCASDAGCGKRTDNLAASMRRTAADMPERWLLLPINGSMVRVVTFFGLAESTPMVAPPSAPLTLGAWLSAAEGDPSGLWLLSFVGDFFPWPFVWGQYGAGASLDAQAAREYFAASSEDRTSFGWVGSAFPWGGGRLADGWPAAADVDAYGRVQSSDVETLLISGALDTSTPPQPATEELLPYLSNGHQVVLPGVGHIASFFTEQPDAGTHLINTFYASGRVDDSLYTSQRVDLTPDTPLTWMAKVFLGAMLAVASIALLSLVLMTVRVRRRGPFGRMASGALRSVYPIVLGLGGWFFGVLVVPTIWPSVKISDEWIAILAIGMPVGAGVALAWLDPADQRARRMSGCVAAVGGALIGGWLGFHVTQGLPAVLTTIVAAIATANIALLGLDALSTAPSSTPAARAPDVQAAAPQRVVQHI